MVFGGAASAQLDAVLAMAMSLFIFSGALQFAVLSLLAGGAGTLAVLLTALALNTRHLVLAAILRPRLELPAGKRALLAWFLIDESFGLALAAGRRVGLVLLVSGALFYVAWQLGTLLGILGAQVVALEGMASAIFPVLFIGLAAITVRGPRGVLRTVTAGVLVALLTPLLAGAHNFLPILAAVVVALPGTRRP